MGEPHCCSQRVLQSYNPMQQTLRRTLFTFSVRTKVLTKEINFADQLFCRLRVVKDPAQVSALPQLQRPRTATLALCGTLSTLTSPPATSLKTPGILFFIFIAAQKNKWLVMMSYFSMDLLCLQSSLKAAAKGCICCWVCWFVCFQVTHSNNFARALRCRYVPEN